MSEVLKIENLSICFNESKKNVISNLSLKIARAETLGLVGESGSGKSLTALSILKLLPDSARVSEGEIYLNGELLDPNSKQRPNVAIILQDPTTSLNPLKKVGKQMLDILMSHSKQNKKEAKKAVLEWIHKVNLPEPENCFNKYPYELSGGQQQRVMIAIALSLKPSLLIADEPTTALDTTVQKEVLKLLKKLVSEQQSSLLLISHDLQIVSDLCDRVAIMKSGEIIENSDTKTIFENANSSYTRSLISAKPCLKMTPHRLLTIEDYQNGKTIFESKSYHNKDTEILLEVNALNFFYDVTSMLPFRKKSFHALKDINFKVKKGEVLGIVGESGSGKTTLAENIALLKKPKSGSIKFDGIELNKLRSSKLKAVRKDFQYIFQSTLSVLNPFHTIDEILTEPLRIHKIKTKKTYSELAGEILEKVGLSKADLKKYPREFSGGQRQRICIARALLLEPKLLILDEAVSALDVSIQAQILNLLLDLRDEFSLSYLFISHDLSIVKFFCDRVIVMKDGVILEEKNTQELFSRPEHSFTKELIDAISLSD